VKARSTVIQGVLALLGLLAAYFTWQRPKETVATEAVKVVDATKQSLEKIHFDDGVRFLDLARKTDGEPSTWITMGYLPGKRPQVVDAGPPPAPDAGRDGGALDGGAHDAGAVDGGADGGLRVNPPPPPVQRIAEPPPTREVRGGERADALWAKFAPFEATRALGTLSAEKLKELGLAENTRTLDLTVAGTTRHFAVSRPLPGVIGAYLLDTASKEVYLLPGTLLTELDPTSQMLVDRRLHAFKQSEFDRFTVVVGEQRKTYAQTDAEQPAKLKVAPEDALDKPDEMAKNWHDKVFNRLVVTEVLGTGEQPAGGAPEVKLRIEYTGKGKEKGFLELALDKNRSPWARTEHTASWVAVHQGAEEMLLEAPRMVEKK